METIPEVTLEDLVTEPVEDYINFEGENRIFIIFNTISPNYFTEDGATEGARDVRLQR